MQRLKTQRLPNTQPCPPHPGRAGKEEKPRGCGEFVTEKGNWGWALDPSGARDCGARLEASSQGADPLGRTLCPAAVHWGGGRCQVTSRTLLLLPSELPHGQPAYHRVGVPSHGLEATDASVPSRPLPLRTVLRLEVSDVSVLFFSASVLDQQHSGLGWCKRRRAAGPAPSWSWLRVGCGAGARAPGDAKEWIFVGSDPFLVANPPPPSTTE